MTMALQFPACSDINDIDISSQLMLAKAPSKPSGERMMGKNDVRGRINIIIG